MISSRILLLALVFVSLRSTSNLPKNITDRRLSNVSMLAWYFLLDELLFYWHVLIFRWLDPTNILMSRQKISNHTILWKRCDVIYHTVKKMWSHISLWRRCDLISHTRSSDIKSKVEVSVREKELKFSKVMTSLWCKISSSVYEVMTTLTTAVRL